MQRLSKHHRLWKMAFDVAEFATCDRAHHGCVIGDEGIVIATGYNGSLDGDSHCDEVGHDIIVSYRIPNGKPIEHCVRTIHAERNAVLNAAMVGTSIRGKDWYITGIPCPECSKMILRTKPQWVYICSDRGCISNEEKRLALPWWGSAKDKHKIKLCFAMYNELVEMGIAK